MSKIIKIVAVLFATTILFTACTNPSNQNSSSIVALGEEKMQELYKNQNFFLTGTESDYYKDVYENNRNYVYVSLFYYNWKENQDLTYEEIVEYLSSEYEDDGAVRIYNNGNWPRIESYINYCNQQQKELDFFTSTIINMTLKQYESHPEIGTQGFFNLSKHNLYEVMESVKDENYVPNFTPGNKFEVGEATKK